MRKLLFTLAALASPAALHAQAYQCRVPQRITLPAVHAEAPPRRVPVTGYTLALSWSPEYCRTRETRRADAMQCSGANGRFGFIVHGLWPEGRSTSPQWCPTSRSPQPATARESLCMTPSPRLIAREWAKHGACMTRTPAAYFKVTRILWRSLKLPDMDRLSRKEGLTADDIRAEFVRLNGRHWRGDMIGIATNRRGWVEELHLCYGKDFMPTRCQRYQYGAKDAAKVKVWRGL